MNKIYLNQYFSIVLSLVFLLVCANNAYVVYLLNQLAVDNKAIFSDTGFQLKFFETIFYSAVYLTVSIYFAVMSIIRFPLIEQGKTKKTEEDSE